VNPPYRATGVEPCRAFDPLTGLCHQIQESDYTNNVGEVTIDIPAHLGRDGVGPMAGSAVLDEEPGEHGERIEKK
jgi:hypothetical protein